MSIILLRGYSQSGKDFIGEILCNNYGYKRFAFADSLKKMVQQEFKCSWEDLHTQDGKLKICNDDYLKRTYRQILIDEAIRLRNIDSDVFGKHCCSEINGFKETLDKIVITDWRYPNETTIMEESFPGYTITPVHIIRQGQHISPVNDISEYQLNDRNSDYQLINNMDNTIYNELKLLNEFIYFKKNN